MRQLFVVTAQRAAHALRVVVMTARQPVVAEQQQSARERCTQCSDPGRNAQTHLRGIAARQRLGQSGEDLIAGAREARVGRNGALAEPERRAGPCGLTVSAPGHDTELTDTVGLAPEAPARQRVGHLVGEHHSVPGPLGQPLEPHDALAQRLRQTRQALALALREIGAHFENRVALGQQALRCELGEHRRGHPSGAGAELEDLPARAHEHGGALARDAAGKEVGDLGSGDEVPARAEFLAPDAVVAEARRVQRQLHETLERQPAARGRERLADVRGETQAVRLLLGRQWREH